MALKKPISPAAIYPGTRFPAPAKSTAEKIAAAVDRVDPDCRRAIRSERRYPNG
jgi:hypothetical protein